MVATSKAGSASAAMSFGGGGGSGIVHAVSGVARANTSGRRRASLGPCARDRVSVGIEFSFVIAAYAGNGHLERGAL